MGCGELLPYHVVGRISGQEKLMMRENFVQRDDVPHAPTYMYMMCMPFLKREFVGEHQTKKSPGRGRAQCRVYYGDAG